MPHHVRSRRLYHSYGGKLVSTLIQQRPRHEPLTNGPERGCKGRRGLEDSDDNEKSSVSTQKPAPWGNNETGLYIENSPVFNTMRKRLSIIQGGAPGISLLAVLP